MKSGDELMNKQEIYAFLKNENIPFEVTEHAAVYNMAELEKVELPYPEYDAKNLFVRDDKKQNYYLITVKGDKKVDLKDFAKKQNIRRLSFASAQDLQDILGLIPGAVTPLGLLNDSEHKVSLYIDKEFFKEPNIIGVHPNDNTATLWLNANDLLKLLQSHGTAVTTLSL